MYPEAPSLAMGQHQLHIFLVISNLVMCTHVYKVSGRVHVAKPQLLQAEDTQH